MTKKDIKTFFKAIADGDINKVSELINSDKEYLTVYNTAPPKKYDGQSGLQVAFKTGNFDIAKLLIEQGADVNFKETSEINEWTAPVLHDSIRATIFNTYTVQKNTTVFDKAFSLLQLMLNKGANPNSTDSYGNNCLHRALMDARQMIDNPQADLTNGTLLEQLRKVFNQLINAGADPNCSNEKRDNAMKMLTRFKLTQYNLTPWISMIKTNQF
jgi:ankyrin repeat protein